MFSVSEIHTQTHMIRKCDSLFVHKSKFHAFTAMYMVHLGKVYSDIVKFTIMTHLPSQLCKKTLLGLSDRKFHFSI